MNRRLVAIGALAAILGVLMTACIPPADEAVGNAEKEVQERVVNEGIPLLYDNGKNFLVVNDFSYSVVIVVLQQWLGEHPDKHLVGSPAYTHNSSWIAYYEKKSEK